MKNNSKKKISSFCKSIFNALIDIVTYRHQFFENSWFYEKNIEIKYSAKFYKS